MFSASIDDGDDDDDDDNKNDDNNKNDNIKRLMMMIMIVMVEKKKTLKNLSEMLIHSRLLLIQVVHFIRSVWCGRRPINPALTIDLQSCECLTLILPDWNCRGSHG